MLKRRIEIDPAGFPERIRGLLDGAKAYDNSCHSGAAVYYADTGFYIKTDAPGGLAREAELGRLFHERGYGAEVVDYIRSDRDYLVTRRAEGEDLTHCLDYPEKICEILADALRRLHGETAEGMPVSLKAAEYGAVDGGKYAGGDPGFARSFGIASREDALYIVRKNGGLLAWDSVIHGDACLPNVLQKDDRFSAFVDFAVAGAGDRHIDLYWACWSLWFNLKTDKYTDCFLDMYGRDAFSMDALRTAAAYELLCE